MTNPRYPICCNYCPSITPKTKKSSHLRPESLILQGTNVTKLRASSLRRRRGQCLALKPPARWVTRQRLGRCKPLGLVPAMRRSIRTRPPWCNNRSWVVNKRSELGNPRRNMGKKWETLGITGNEFLVLTHPLPSGNPWKSTMKSRFYWGLSHSNLHFLGGLPWFARILMWTERYQGWPIAMWGPVFEGLAGWGPPVRLVGL